MESRRITQPATPTGKARFAHALLESEIENSLDGILVVHADAHGALYNPRCAAMWALPAGDARTDDPDDILRRILARVKDPSSFAIDVRRFRQPDAPSVHRELELLDGRVVETRSGAIKATSGEQIGRIWYFRDVTRQRHSEAALRASHALLATTERIAHVGGWEHDVERNVLVWSEETYRIFGRATRSYAPTVEGFLESVHPDDRERVRQGVEASQRGTPFRMEFRIVRPDGVGRTVDAQAEIELGADGKAIRLVGTTRDVTEQKATEEKLRRAVWMFASQLESLPDAILVVSADRRIVSYNRKFIDLWSIPDDIARSGSDERALASVVGQIKDPQGFVARVEALYANPEECAQEDIELDDGRVFERHTSPLPIATDETPARIFCFRDITARRRAEEHVARLARHDPLTGLANRSAFVQAVQHAIARAGRGAKGFALLYIDLDHFKDVNDTLGHPAGDELLKSVAERFQKTVRESDIVARFGGDEFAVLQADVTEPTVVAALAERLQSTMRDPFPILGNDLRVGVSIGMALYGPTVSAAELLLSHADLALYRAKTDGRGTYRFYAEGMDDAVRARVALVSDMREGLDAGQFFLVYQPQVEIASGRIVGVEALARWRHPRRGLVSPGDFIPVAEKSGLIVPLGRWVMRTACEQAKRWLDAGIAPDVVAVNVSGSQFRTPLELQSTLSTVLGETGLPAGRLEVELTESVLMDAWLEQRDVLLRLRQSGTKISLDDFGTGFSSLQYLSRFPVDRIKIDRSFVLDLVAGSGNAAIVRATLGMARELGLQVVAEGVETRAQLELLREWGCGDAQGYYFAKPLPVDEVEAILRRGTMDSRLPGPASAASRPSGVWPAESCSGP